MAERDSNGFLWFLAGLGVGAVVGVLYAPKAGDELRETLRSKAQEGSEKAKEGARRAREQASEWVDRGADVLSAQKERFRSAYEAGRQAYSETTAGEAPKN
jgi:gas vesicle protein